MITIRSARENDLPGLLEIYNEIILNTTAVYQYVPQTLDMRKAWYDTKRKEGHPVCVAESGGRVVGFSSYGPFRAWAAYKYTVENSVYVADDQRGKGIGNLLIPPLIQAAKENDLHPIIATIDASNAASIKLHQSFEFEDLTHFRHSGYKFPHSLNLNSTKLLLNTPPHPQQAYSPHH